MSLIFNATLSEPPGTTSASWIIAIFLVRESSPKNNAFLYRTSVDEPYKFYHFFKTTKQEIESMFT